jgi:hypothetical protein
VEKGQGKRPGAPEGRPGAPLPYPCLLLPNSSKFGLLFAPLFCYTPRNQKGGERMKTYGRKPGLYWMENTAWYADGSGSYRDMGRMTEAAAWDWCRRHAVRFFKLSPAPSLP